MDAAEVAAAAAAAGVALTLERATAALPLVRAMEQADAELRALDLDEPP